MDMENLFPDLIETFAIHSLDIANSELHLAW